MATYHATIRRARRWAAGKIRGLPPQSSANAKRVWYDPGIMVTLNAHFDGKVIVPDEPLALKPNQRLRISVEPIEVASKGIDLNWLRGAGVQSSTNPAPRFQTNDDLWDKAK